MEFRTIPNIESKTKIYEASNKGGVIRSKSKKTGEYRILSQSKTHTGYNTVGIGLVHVLVALTFLGNRPDDTYTVDHKDNTDKKITTWIIYLGKRNQNKHTIVVRNLKLKLTQCL